MMQELISAECKFGIYLEIRNYASHECSTTYEQNISGIADLIEKFARRHFHFKYRNFN